MSKPEVRVRAWREQDIPAVIEVQRSAYPDYPDDEQYGRRKFGLAFATFPEGQLLAEVDGPDGRPVIVGYATALIVQLDDEVPYTYEEITGHGTFSSHTPAGDTLYGADIAVHPDFQGLGVAQALWVGRRELMRAYNLRRMLAYGRLLGFPEHAGRLTAREYVDEVVAGELHDRALTAHLRAGYRVSDVRLDLMVDPSSLDWATILELPNPDFSSERRQIAAAPLRRAARRMRVCAVQYLMRSALGSWEDFRRSVEFFVDAADDYHAHLLVFPELFTLQLLTTMPRLSDHAAMARLSAMIDDYRGMFSELARDRGLYIVGGSTPVERDGRRYNVGHLFTPTGAIHTQDKLHVTPYERERWGIRPGSGLHVFETPLGRLAMQICYDIEFPEPSRLLTFAGAEVVVVPFSTDERRAYLRVRNCAHARAIENNVYVVLAGNAGNLPARGNLINYARSAVLTPSDFGFPPEGVAAEADPNVETVAIADLDFSILAQLREMGSVRPLHDRRGDMYKLTGDRPPKVHQVH